MSKPTDLPPSRLGTKEHWDNVYSSELATFEEIGDEGEIWFGEDSVRKMVDWIAENVPSGDSPTYILEIGTGNGNLLLALHDEGYASHGLCGIDYSEDAIALAKAVARSRFEEEEDDDDDEEEKDEETFANGPAAITFEVCDFLRDEVPTILGMSGESSAVWDLVLDKGTFDAMALAEKDSDGKTPSDNYPSRVEKAVKPGGFFLITSCNFTEEELKAKFVTPETGLTYHSRIQFPTFSFGGKTGNVYSSVAFQMANP